MIAWATWLVCGAYAEDSEFAGTVAPPEEQKTELTAELGGTLATGNSNYYAVNGGMALKHTAGKNQLTVGAGLNLGAARAVIDTDGDGVPEGIADQYTENARRLFADARYDRFLSDKDSLYALAGAFHDRFAGFDLRAHEQLGYSRRLVKDDDTELRVEIGADWAQEDYVTDVDPNYANVIAARLLVGVSHKFSEQVAFSDTAEIYENVINVDDVRILNNATLTSALSGKLSLKLTHALIFDNVPVEGFRPLDQTTMVTLVATLL
ncbi:MAG: DUF481 domain-containing protein [Myxococcota bacterium]